MNVFLGQFKNELDEDYDVTISTTTGGYQQHNII